MIFKRIMNLNFFYFFERGASVYLYFMNTKIMQTETWNK
jgi:hypothetical protein